MSDRFYQALYAKLLDPSLKTSSKQASSSLWFSLCFEVELGFNDSDNDLLV